jgi:hypothetical protein
MDNLSRHKVKGVAESIESANAQLLLLVTLQAWLRPNRLGIFETQSTDPIFEAWIRRQDVGYVAKSSIVSTNQHFGLTLRPQVVAPLKTIENKAT